MDHSINNPAELPIAVFDSGIGGLTVLSSLQHLLPNESFLYLGDTARLPYGTKSANTVIHYAVQAAQILINQGIKLLVVACNTASTLALTALQQHFPQIPIIGVVKPGAESACHVTKNNQIAVIATEATVLAEGYQQAIQLINPQAKVIAKSCSLFVALAEEGWVTGPIAEMTTKEYLEPLLNNHPADCLLLGCTHFPTLTATIRKSLSRKITIIDSAESTAQSVKETLHQLGLNRTTAHTPRVNFMVTDSPERFARVAKNFLQKEINATDISWVDNHFTALQSRLDPEQSTQS